MPYRTTVAHEIFVFTFYVRQNILKKLLLFVFFYEFASLMATIDILGFMVCKSVGLRGYLFKWQSDKNDQFFMCHQLWTYSFITTILGFSSNSQLF